MHDDLPLNMLQLIFEENSDFVAKKIDYFALYYMDIYFLNVES